MSELWESLKTVGKGAVLAETSESDQVAASTIGKRKAFRHPVAFEDAFNKAKKEGRITGTWSAYITEAVRLKLTNDGFL